MLLAGKRWLKLFMFIIVIVMEISAASGQEAGQAIIRLDSGRMSTFQLFQKITRQTGYFFIYDSELIRNERLWNFRRGQYTVNDILNRIVNDIPAGFRFEGNYIIFFPDPSARISSEEIPEPALEILAPTDSFFVVSGRIIDGKGGQPLSYATILINRRGRGISSNSEGGFRLRIPMEFLQDTLKVSYMGFAPRFIPLALLKGTTTEIVLNPEMVSLHEIVVSGYDPRQILSRAISRIPILYSQKPSIHTSFYREGVLRGEHILNYSEAVFEIFRSAQGGVTTDQVKLLKSRNVSNAQDRDTIMVKLKAGVQNALELDIIKNPVDFVMAESINDIAFPAAGLIWHNNKLVYEIDFRSNSIRDDNVYEGTIYIDRESLAILQVNFGIIPAYLRRHQNRFFIRRSEQHITTINQIRYIVNYGLFDGSYHVNHIRCDIDLRIRERNRLRGNNYNAFFEMATMEIRTENVRRFARRDALRTSVVFADQNQEYDAEFWMGFNFIIPESAITRSLRDVRTNIDISFPED